MFTAFAFSSSPLLGVLALAFLGWLGACAVTACCRRWVKAVAEQGRRYPVRCLLLGGVPVAFLAAFAFACSRAGWKPHGDSDFTPLLAFLFILAGHAVFFLAGFVPALAALAALLRWPGRPYQAVWAVAMGVGLTLLVPYAGTLVYAVAAAWGAGGIILWLARRTRTPG